MPLEVSGEVFQSTKDDLRARVHVSAAPISEATGNSEAKKCGVSNVFLFVYFQNNLAC